LSFYAVWYNEARSNYMSQIIELPDPVFGQLQQAAEAAGVTPQAWIAARLAERHPASAADVKAPSTTDNDGAQQPPKTMADLFAGRVGRIRTGNKNLSENCGEKFTDHLEAKRREGRL